MHTNSKNINGCRTNRSLSGDRPAAASPERVVHPGPGRTSRRLCRARQA
jgi:hypothetical protein